MKSIKLIPIFIIISLQAFAQLTAPVNEGLFGGSILDITGYAKSLDSTIIFVSTESPNSVFKASVKTTSSQLKADSFTVLPSLSSANGFGSNLNSLAFDPLNKWLFFGHFSGLYYTTETASQPTLVDNFSTQTVFIKDSILFYFQQNGLNFKKIRSGALISSGIPNYVFSGAPNSFSIAIHPINHLVYVMIKNNGTPIIYKSSAPFYTLSASSTFTPISISGVWPNVSWEGLGIGPDGRIFAGGADFGSKKVVYSDNELSWNFVNTNVAGRHTPKFSFAGNASNYTIHYATAISVNKGLNWKSLGSVYQETHPNDGYVFVSPVSSNCIFFNTDAGLGASVNQGDSVFDINLGIEALQINGMDMNAVKSGAWIASKAGLRKNTQFQAIPKKWSKAFFPNGDGSPFFSVSIVQNDTNRVYAGNIRIYKSSDGGNTWSMPFTPETPPHNFPSFGLRCTKIAMGNLDTQLVMVSYAADSPSRGGLFYSLNAGNSWTQLRISPGVPGIDVNVNDIVISKENTDTVAYVALSHAPFAPHFSGVFKLIKNGPTWVVNRDFDSSNMASGQANFAHVYDLELSKTGDTLFAGATINNSGIQVPIIYMKLIKGLNKWQALKMDGFPTQSSAKINVALGIDTLYASVNEELLAFPLKDSIWFRAVQYPAGSSIHFLYYDELLAGTGSGLYGHLGKLTTCRPQINQFDQSICYGEFYTLPDSNRVSNEGKYQILYKNKNGCDSIVTISLTVNKPDVSISAKKDTLVSNESNATAYQWLDCGAGFLPVTGATQRSFIPPNPGIYAVEVRMAFCRDTSVCIPMGTIGLDQEAKEKIKIYPNPGNSIITISGALNQTCELSIFDLQGKCWKTDQVLPIESNQIRIDDLQAGFYFLILRWVQNGQVYFFQEKYIVQEKD